MLKPSLQLRLGQQLTMTPQLQQAIRLLQLPVVDLQMQIQEALESNVMLEAEEPAAAETPEAADEAAAESETESDVELSAEADWSSEQSVGPGDSPHKPRDSDETVDYEDHSHENLRDHLMWQIELENFDERARMIGRAIVDAINDDGYLTEPLAEIRQTLLPEVEAEEDEIEATLMMIQRLDPVGVGARSVGECVLLQLGQLDPDTPGLDAARTIAREHLDLVAEQQYGAIKRRLRIDDGELDVALALVRGCHPRPGAAVYAPAAEYVVPDVFVRRVDQRWIVELNPSSLPRLRVNQTYAGLIGRNGDYEALRAQLQEARWLIRSLEIRNDTLLRVAGSIVERQQAFLEHGEEHMRPMVLKDVAESVEMHESTISRVTMNKYMHTPRGVFEFRYFFSSQVGSDDGGESSTAVKARIRKLVAQENAAKPLSDSRIAKMLADEGIQIARRTVAKYREALGIAPSSERRRRQR